MPSSITNPVSHNELHRLAELIKTWGRELGFQQVGITDTQWLLMKATLTLGCRWAITARWASCTNTVPSALAQKS